MNWFNTKAGKNLLQFEKVVINKFVQQKFGYYAVQLSAGEVNFLEHSKIKSHFFTYGKAQSMELVEDSLPFDSSSVDLIIASHIFEKINDTQTLVDELFRVILPGGYVVISTFNPISFAGARSFFGFDNYFPWNTSFLSMRKLQGQLIDGGFSVTEAKVSFYQPLFLDDKPFFNKTWESFGDRWFPFLGNIYFIVVQKKVSGLIPIKPKWRKIKQSIVVANKKYD